MKKTFALLFLMSFTLMACGANKLLFNETKERVRTGNPNSRYITWRSKEIPAKPNTWYRASADVKMATNNTPGQVRYRIREIRANGKSIRYNNVANLRPTRLDFEPHSTIFMTRPNCVKLQVYYILDRIDGKVHFRNSKIEELSKEEAEKVLASQMVEPAFFSPAVYAFTGETAIPWGYTIAKLFVPKGKLPTKITFAIPQLKVNAAATKIQYDKHMRSSVKLAKPLAKGAYKIEMAAFNAKGEKVLAQTFTLRVIDRPNYAKRLPVKSVTIDTDGNTIINGKKVFLNGLYHVYSPQETRDINYVGFNAAIAWTHKPDTYKKMLDFFADNDLYADCVLKFISGKKLADLMAAIKDHPSIISWDIVDEPAIRNIKPARLMPCVNDVRSYKTNRPLRISFADQTAPPDYRACYDIAAVHKYTIPFAGFNSLYDSIKLMESYFPLPRKNSPQFTLQIWLHSHDNTRRPITPDQIRTQAYLAVIGGMKGIWWYSFREKGSWDVRSVPSMWSAFKGLNAELFELNDFIFGKRNVVSTGSKDVAAATFTAGNRTVLIVANMAKEKRTVAVRAVGRRMLKPLFASAETNGGLITLEKEQTAIYEVR